MTLIVDTPKNERGLEVLSVAVWELLNRPVIAVGVVEEDERKPPHDLDLADLDSAFRKLGVRLVDVPHHQLQALG